MFVLGLDVGTQGARAIIVDLEGRVNSEAVRDFAEQLAATTPGHFEQDPRQWREAASAAIAVAVTVAACSTSTPRARRARSVRCARRRAR